MFTSDSSTIVYHCKSCSISNHINSILAINIGIPNPWYIRMKTIFFSLSSLCLGYAQYWYMWIWFVGFHIKYHVVDDELLILL